LDFVESQKRTIDKFLKITKK